MLITNNVAMIERLRKMEGTSYWHESQWFDLLAAYSNRCDNGQTVNMCGPFRSWRNSVPNRKNVQLWRDFIAALTVENPELDAGDDDQGVIPTDLKGALLSHLDAMLDYPSKPLVPCRMTFSRTGDWKYMRDISAASCFLNLFSQACNYGH